MFLWELECQAIQTKQKLQKLFPEQNSLCVLCSKEESLVHLFLTCEFTQLLWNTFAQGYGQLIPAHTSIGDRIKAWASHRWQQESVEWFWSRAPVAIWWLVWLHRNEIVFEGKAVDWQETWLATLLRLRFWGQSMVLKHILIGKKLLDCKVSLTLMLCTVLFFLFAT